MPIAIALKRAYEKPARTDGFRVLVDRVWPWAKEIAPSTALRKWFAHDPDRWSEFRKRYRSELTQTHASRTVSEILDAAKPAKTITLVYGAKDTEHNQAVVLRDLFEKAACSLPTSKRRLVQ